MPQTPLQAYLAKTAPDQINNATVAHLANIAEAAKVYPVINGLIVEKMKKIAAVMRFILVCTLQEVLRKDSEPDFRSTLRAFTA